MYLNKRDGSVQILALEGTSDYMLVAGNTGKGKYLSPIVVLIVHLYGTIAFVYLPLCCYTIKSLYYSSSNYKNPY